MLTRQIRQQNFRKSSRTLFGSMWNFGCSRGTKNDFRVNDLRVSDVQSRMYHASAKREILPLIAASSLLMIGRWSWKALNRMDEEWEDYQWQLQQYELERMRDSSEVSDIATIGVDPGSVYLKLATIDGDNPELVTTPQGDRYRFVGIMKGEQMEEFVSGVRAMEKFYYVENKHQSNGEAGEDVILPLNELKGLLVDESSLLVKHVVAPAVKEAMERLEKPQTRVVLTLPPTIFKEKENMLLQNMKDNEQHSIIVPDPVASIWGARIMGLLPHPTTKEEKAETSLVVDIGGLSTSVSVVSGDVVEATCYIEDLGGESYVQRIVSLVQQEAGDEIFTNDAMCLALIDSSARSATIELVNKTDVQVQIPFLFMGRKRDDPHFDLRLSRSLVEKTVEDHLINTIVPRLTKGATLSTALPSPTSASALIASALTKVLQDCELMPKDVTHVILVGGGSKHPLFERAFREGAESLIGPSSQTVVVPEIAVRADITALGASSLLPSFDYSRESGLELVSKKA